jgi:hypothetical protein
MTGLSFVAAMVVAGASVWLAKAAAQEPEGAVPAAGPMLPRDVVARLVRAAQNNRLDGVLATADFAAIARGHHGTSAAHLVSALRRIDVTKTQFLGAARLAVPPNTDERVTLDGTYQLQFDLELVATSRVFQGSKTVDLPPRYVVVSRTATAPRHRPRRSAW